MYKFLILKGLNVNSPVRSAGKITGDEYRTLKGFNFPLHMACLVLPNLDKPEKRLNEIGYRLNEIGFQYI